VVAHKETARIEKVGLQLKRGKTFDPAAQPDEMSPEIYNRLLKND
jgi:hypothetical protein